MSAKTDGVYKNIDISFKIRQIHINKTSRFPSSSGTLHPGLQSYYSKFI